ncbi:MAG TPA: 23S rRNA (adenine(2503)-C(2))-methyltransferase RlmN, partial [Blastocatellia bacterium]|nr:23S rRNA (adenine(2503)-C(2))-methyltransferase RlmN [Blastocatellia bacterium]
MDDRKDLAGMTQEEVRLLLERLGEPRFRARQLFAGIHHRRLDSFDLFTDLPKELRERLKSEAVPGSLRVGQVFESSDGTRRFLLELPDGLEVETVFMPEERRETICISSQIGCPLACDFCVTGVLGLKRNLSSGEIVSQVLTGLNYILGTGVPSERPVNVVIMGMGEPLLNYDNVLKAVRLLTDQEGLGIPARRITLSTAGIVPKMYDLGKEPVRPKLAISLTAATDELRGRLFPINRKYPLEV